MKSINRFFLLLFAVILIFSFDVNSDEVSVSGGVSISGNKESYKAGESIAFCVSLNVVNSKDLNFDKITLKMPKSSKLSVLSISTKPASFIDKGNNKVKITLKDSSCFKIQLYFNCKLSDDVSESFNVNFGTASISLRNNNDFSVRLGSVSVPVKAEHAHEFDEGEYLLPFSCDLENKKKYVCKTCGYEEIRIIQPGSHDMGDYEILKKPSCIEKGLRQRKCKKCAYKLDEEIEKTEHSYTEKIIKESDCKNHGYEQLICSVCGAEGEKTELELKEHEWGNFVIPESRDCLEGWIETAKCKNCDETTERKIKKAEHELKHTVIEQPSCTRKGKKREYCENCSHLAEMEMPKLEHEYGEFEAEAGADCEKGYYLRAQCRHCGEEKAKFVEKQSHAFGATELQKEASCTLDGLAIRKCRNCRKIKELVIPKKGHMNFTVLHVRKESSCKERGYGEYVCSECGYRKKQELALKPHDIERLEIQKLSCSSDGIIEKRCKNCDFYERTVRPKLRHSIIYSLIRKNTCYQEGLYEGKCLFCDEYFSKTTPKLEHEFDREDIIRSASCRQTGLKRKHCRLCNLSIDEESKKLDHDLYGLYTVKLGNCRNKTHKRAKCSMCQEEIDIFEEAFNHELGEWEYSVKNCAEGGARIKRCKLCSYSEKELIKPKKHNFGRAERLKEPTCIEKGISRHSCKTCGYTEENTIESSKHDFSDWEKRYENCEKQGLATRKCRLCGFLEQKDLPAKKHNFGRVERLKEPTCIESGISKRSCKTCSYTEENEISPTGHKKGKWKAIGRRLPYKKNIDGLYCRKCGELIEQKSYYIDAKFFRMLIQPEGVELGDLIECKRKNLKILPLDLKKLPLEYKLIGENRIIGKIKLSLNENRLVTRLELFDENTVINHCYFHIYTAISDIKNTDKRIKGYSIDSEINLNRLNIKDDFIYYFLRLEGAFDITKNPKFDDEARLKSKEDLKKLLR